MDRSHKKDHAIIFTVIWLIIWEIAALIAGNELILPGPAETVKVLMGLVVTGSFWLDVIWTVFRVCTGILISFSAGFACAVFASGNSRFRQFLTLPVNLEDSGQTNNKHTYLNPWDNPEI